MILDFDGNQMTGAMGEPESTPGYDKCRKAMTCWVNTNWSGYIVMASAVYKSWQAWLQLYW